MIDKPDQDRDELAQLIGAFVEDEDKPKFWFATDMATMILESDVVKRIKREVWYESRAVAAHGYAECPFDDKPYETVYLTGEKTE